MKKSMFLTVALSLSISASGVTEQDIEEAVNHYTFAQQLKEKPYMEEQIGVNEKEAWAKVARVALSGFEEGGSFANILQARLLNQLLGRRFELSQAATQSLGMTHDQFDERYDQVYADFRAFNQATLK